MLSSALSAPLSLLPLSPLPPSLSLSHPIITNNQQQNSFEWTQEFDRWEASQQEWSNLLRGYELWSQILNQTLTAKSLHLITMFPPVFNSFPL